MRSTSFGTFSEPRTRGGVSYDVEVYGVFNAVMCLSMCCSDIECLLAALEKEEGSVPIKVGHVCVRGRVVTRKRLTGLPLWLLLFLSSCELVDGLPLSLAICPHF